MSIDPNLLIAAKLIHDECVKNSSCTNCQLRDICVWESAPNDWEIPDPPPEPTERQRIEWLRCLPDDEMLDAVNHIGPHSLFPWHEVVSLEQFRKDVGLDNDTDS